MLLGWGSVVGPFGGKAEIVSAEQEKTLKLCKHADVRIEEEV